MIGPPLLNIFFVLSANRRSENENFTSVGRLQNVYNLFPSIIGALNELTPPPSLAFSDGVRHEREISNAGR